MNVGWSTPADSSYSVPARKLKELAEKHTDGAVEVKLRCCAQIATEDDAVKAMQLGTVDAYFISQNNVSPHWPLMDVFVLPYIFHTEDHVTKVTTVPVGDTIPRVTSLPASRLGLGNRGTLTIGKWVDVTVCDPTQIKSRFSVPQPRRYPGGIAHVMVNGKLAMQGGQRSDSNSGQVLHTFQA